MPFQSTVPRPRGVHESATITSTFTSTSTLTSTFTKTITPAFPSTIPWIEIVIGDETREACGLGHEGYDEHHHKGQ